MSAPRFPLERVAEQAGGTLEGPGDLEIRGVAPIEEAGPNHVTFIAGTRYVKMLATTGAGAALVPPGVEVPDHIVAVRVENPYFALLKVLGLFDPGPPAVEPGVHSTASVSPDADLGENVAVGPGAVVAAGARIGRGTRLGPHAVVEEGARLGEDCYLYPRTYVGRRCRLGDRVTLYPGAVVGSDGFGYAPVDGRYIKIPQLGIAVLGDDVTVGANSCIDRAALGETRIGTGTKIDNLVQLGHNVEVGEHCVLAALTGIAGSAKIGDRARFGGKSGMSGHIRAGNDVTVAAHTVITRDAPDGQTIMGFPGRPRDEFLKAQALLRRLPKIERRLRELEARGREEE